MSNRYPQINQIFDDLDKFRDYCRFNGKVFDEADLYRDNAPVYHQYKQFLHWSKNKHRTDRRPARSNRSGR